LKKELIFNDNNKNKQENIINSPKSKQNKSNELISIKESPHSLKTSDNSRNINENNKSNADKNLIIFDAKEEDKVNYNCNKNVDEISLKNEEDLWEIISVSSLIDKEEMDILVLEKEYKFIQDYFN